jgi:hypothetical protein
MDKISEDKLLRRILGPKRNETIGGWRKICNDELHNLYSSPNTIRVIKSRMIMGRACSTHVVMRNAYRILVGKPSHKKRDN